MGDQFYWYATRSAGVLALGCALLAILLGLALASRVFGAKPGYPWLLDLHRFVSGVSVLFLAVHMLTLWADDFVTFGLAELLIPGRSSTQTAAVNWGVYSAWGLGVIQLSSLLKSQLPKQVWRSIHLGSYLVAVTGTVHAYKAGSDIDNLVLVVFAGLLWIGIISGTVVRVRVALKRRKGPADQRRERVPSGIRP